MGSYFILITPVYVVLNFPTRVVLLYMFCKRDSAEFTDTRFRKFVTTYIG